MLGAVIDEGDLRLDEIGWSLVEPVDKIWKGLTELFFSTVGSGTARPKRG